jgi:hypothetical protein
LTTPDQKSNQNFISFSECQIYDVSNSDAEHIIPDCFQSIESVKLGRKKWDWLLFFVVIFAVVSTYALIWATGLGILAFTESESKIYFAGWLTQMIALAFHILCIASHK